MSVYKAKKEWRKWNEMVSNSLNAIEDFRDFADDVAIVRADKKIQSLRSKKFNLERQLEVYKSIAEEAIEVTPAHFDRGYGWSDSIKQLKEKDDE